MQSSTTSTRLHCPIDEVDLKSAYALATGANKRQKKYKSLLADSKLMGASSSSKSQILHISEQPWTLSNWYLHINWLNTTLVLGVPLIGLGLALGTPLQLKTAIWTLAYYAISGLGITAGYHRLWSHRSYSGNVVLRLFYACVGAGAIQGSIRWWGHSHRIHHRYTDTNKDPYNAKRGFWFSHIGWMLRVQNPKDKAYADISDLNDDWIVRVQHKYYIFFLIIWAYVFPAWISSFWGDAFGGFVYAGILRAFMIQQATFCVNSLAHWIGTQPFDDIRTPRDHLLTALVTFGEGNHNFHHEFPADYRNAIKWYQYDPTKVAIYITSLVGLAYDLRTVPQNIIDQGVLQQQQKKLDKKRSKIFWGTPIENLPLMDMDEFNKLSSKDATNRKSLVIIGGIVHDITKFINEHPGGESLIKTCIGKDATKVFNGGVYKHSNAAHNMLGNMRTAILKDAKITLGPFGHSLEEYTKK